MKVLSTFTPSKFSRDVILAEFTERISSLEQKWFIEVWTYEMPYSLASGDESFNWHSDKASGLIVCWASVYNIDLRLKGTSERLVVPPRSIILFSDELYEHRVPREVEQGSGIRWFARARIMEESS